MNTSSFSKLNSFAAGATFVAAAIGLLIVTSGTSFAQRDPLINGNDGPAPKATSSKGAAQAPFKRDAMQDVRDDYSYNGGSSAVAKVPSAARVASERDPRCDVRDECTSSIAYRAPVSANARMTQTDEGETKVR